MKFIDLFAGVGGFRRGLELAGHECVGFCEWDKYAVASYTSMHLITDEQRKYLETLPLRDRQKEILKEEYRNGEWYKKDIRDVNSGNVPRADIWCFGAPCQDFSVAGNRKGLEGDRSSLVRVVFDIIRETDEADRPEWLIYENVKGMLSSNAGRDYLAILMEMDELGYDVEWETFNSKDWGVPQNRERVYTVGHLRRYGPKQIFSVTGTDGEDHVQITEEHGIDILGHRNGYRRNTQVFNPEGITETIDTAGGGGREPHTIEIIGKLSDNRHSTTDVYSPDGICATVLGREYKEPKRIAIDVVATLDPNRHSQMDILSSEGIATTVDTLKERKKVAIPVLTPDRAEKRQNGRRFKEDGEPEFTLTAQDIHGVAVDVHVDCFSDQYTGMEESVRTYEEETPTLRGRDYKSPLKVGLPVDEEQGKAWLPVREATKTGYAVAEEGDSINLTAIASHTRRGRVGKGIANTLDTSCAQGVPVVWYDKYQCYIAIRKLTPRECFRLQGWEDKYFDRAQFVNSDSQLYKQAGNGVTVNVVYEIAKRLKE